MLEVYIVFCVGEYDTVDKISLQEQFTARGRGIDEIPVVC